MSCLGGVIPILGSGGRVVPVRVDVHGGVSQALVQPMLRSLSECSCGTTHCSSSNGLLSDVEQIRFDQDDLAASTAAITTGQGKVAQRLGASKDVPTVIQPTQPELFQLSIQMDAQFNITANQVLVGACLLMLVGSLICLSSGKGP
jgi:hypothetical protein